MAKQATGNRKQGTGNRQQGTGEANTSAVSPPTKPAKTYANAMDKLRDEMAWDKSRYAQVVGDYLTDYLLDHPEAEAAILTEGKSIAGSLGAMKDEARKRKQGGVGILDDATAFGIVLDYFGIKAAQNVPKAEQNVPKAAQNVPKAAQNISAASSPLSTLHSPLSNTSPDPFDLDALLGVM